MIIPIATSLCRRVPSPADMFVHVALSIDPCDAPHSLRYEAACVVVTNVSERLYAAPLLASWRERLDATPLATLALLPDARHRGDRSGVLRDGLLDWRTNGFALISSTTRISAHKNGGKVLHVACGNELSLAHARFRLNL